MKIAHEIVTVRTKHPFIIARGGSSDHRTVFVRVTDDDGALSHFDEFDLQMDVTYRV